MPRPRKPGAAEPKTRSRHGCSQCKSRKIKCSEHKPVCANCSKTGQDCDYSIKLNWEGRSRKTQGSTGAMQMENNFGAGMMQMESSGVVKMENNVQIVSPGIGQGQFQSAVQHGNGFTSGEPSPLQPVSLESVKKEDVTMQTTATSPPPAKVTYTAKTVSMQVSDSSLLSPRSRNVDGDTLKRPSSSSSSMRSDFPRVKTATSQLQQARRISIESLISGNSSTGQGGDVVGQDRSIRSHASRSIYGYDPGYPDYDVPYNNDMQALSGNPPLHDVKPFYKAPIKVKIPADFEPLPAILVNEPMNLLYFHHFISHTARILVPHDCSGNPFRKILPRMALKDEHLLRLLLAYSACHRSRLMGYKEPTTRISGYVDNMFSTLLGALKDSRAHISNSTFATAIMLASLDIISPNAFGADTIKWESHLSMARKIITERGIRARTVDRNDDETYFLTRWFAYLDVLGSVTGGQEQTPLYKGDFWADDPQNPHQAHRIDCFFGFTDRCVCIYASLAELARMADEDRRQHELCRQSHETDAPWVPSRYIANSVNRLRIDIFASMQQPYHGCQHHEQSEPNQSCTSAPAGSSAQTTNPSIASPPIPSSSSYTTNASSSSTSNPPSTSRTSTRPGTSGSLHRSTTAELNSTLHALELTTTNECYHWAGLIYLRRRILGHPSSDAQVQDYVNTIVAGLGKIRQGGTAEACMLLPMFIAACEALPSFSSEEDLSDVEGNPETGKYDTTGKQRNGNGTLQREDTTMSNTNNSNNHKETLPPSAPVMDNRARLLERLESVECTGMTQARITKEMVLRVWREGKAWEELDMRGVFIG